MQLITGLIGVIVGGALTYLVQRFESRRVGRLNRTHHLYEAWQSSENITLRVRANEALRQNAEAEDPLV